MRNIRKVTFFNKKQGPPAAEGEPLEPVTVVDVKEADDNVCLKLAMSRRFYEEVHAYLKTKGYISAGREQDGMAILLQFGLSGESRAALEKCQAEFQKVRSRYAAIHYETSELYAKNFEIVKGLQLHLKQNKKLKKKLKECGLERFVGRDDWDNWDDETVHRFYNRYVFCK